MVMPQLLPKNQHQIMRKGQRPEIFTPFDPLLHAKGQGKQNAYSLLSCLLLFYNLISEGERHQNSCPFQFHRKHDIEQLRGELVARLLSYVLINIAMFGEY